MGVYKLSTAGGLATPRTNYSSFLAGNPVFTPPVYDSISTVTVGGTALASITFSSIPATYKHLQVRFSCLTTSNGASPLVQFNSDTGSNYSNHSLYGTGAAAGTGYNASNTGMYIAGSNVGTHTANPTVGILDILDYKNTLKNTTIRGLTGSDRNGSGEITLISGAWYNTAAITTLTISVSSNTFSQYSSFALYGIN
jgi:hypothetical protein